VSFREFVAGELIDIIEWIDETGDTMVTRFSRPKNEIKNGAQLIVRPGQTALFVDQGKIADIFPPGRFELTTANLPLLSTLRGWKYGFASPFKADIIFVNTKQFTNRKWGTQNPVIVRDQELGPVRLRAYGTFAVRVANASQLVGELVGTNSVFLIDEISDQLRDLVVAKVSGVLADGQVSLFDLATKYADVGGRVLERVAPQFKQYGLELTQIVVENVSVPAEVEAAIDQRTKMRVLGDLDAYAKLQSADALRDAARNPSGGAAAGVGIGMGAAVAQRAMTPPVPLTPSTQPPPIPGEAWYYVIAGERRGPVDQATLAQQIKAGAISAETLVWRSGMPDWVALGKMPDLKSTLG
jgi:membrane protease subunit (stomatin/prohibitin family)